MEGGVDDDNLAGRSIGLDLVDGLEYHSVCADDGQLPLIVRLEVKQRMQRQERRDQPQADLPELPSQRRPWSSAICRRTEPIETLRKERADCGIEEG